VLEEDLTRDLEQALARDHRRTATRPRLRGSTDIGT
jgi:hypothetical protein